MKIALIHDFLLEYGGAERVLETLHEMWPEAPIYTAFVDERKLGRHWGRLKSWDIRTSWGQKVPGLRALVSPLRFLAPVYFESFDLSGYEVVISSSNMYQAKAVITRPETLHLCYCHTPPRSLYGYTTKTDWRARWWSRWYGEVVNFKLRQVDWLTAQRPDVIVANSQETQRRIKKFWRRDSVVIYPPVDLPKTKRYPLDANGYYLYVGRLAKMKGVDLAIKACNELKLPLKVVGSGAGEDYLRSIAARPPSAAASGAAGRGETIEFLGSVDDEQLAELYAGCRAVIFPAEDEDFGIVPVEAMAYGKPVIAHNSGGVKETVVDGKTGMLFDDLSVGGLVKAIKKLQIINAKFQIKDIKKQAERFGKERFQDEMRKLVESELEKLKI
jgi:glycosyltransferase involved in cell wall biosynthesis